MKKIILFADNNKSLTLIAIVLGVLIGIFGNGWLGFGSGCAVLIIELLRRNYNSCWSSEYLKRWELLVGMGICIAILITGAFATLETSMSSLLWLAGIITAGLTTLATAWILLSNAWNDFRPVFSNFQWAMWVLYLGIIIMMVTGCYAMLLIAYGTDVSNLLASRAIFYGGCIGGGLITVFLTVLLILIALQLWVKLVTWARN